MKVEIEQAPNFSVWVILPTIIIDFEDKTLVIAWILWVLQIGWGEDK